MSAPPARSATSGQQRCEDCGIFCRRVGAGGCCPHCDEPVAIADLLGPAPGALIGPAEKRKNRREIVDPSARAAPAAADSATSSRASQSENVRSLTFPTAAGDALDT